MSFVQRFSVEHGKLVHGKVHGLECHLLRNRSQAEERGDGGNVQQRGEARMKVCSRRSIFTDENAGSEDFKHTSGEVSLAIESGLGVVVEKKRSRQVFF